jgi:RND family efflux transporter MFP subunit
MMTRAPGLLAKPVERALGRAARCAALAAALCAWPVAQAAPAAGAVATYAVGYRDVADGVAAEGVVEAVRQSTLAAQVAGQIVELRVKVGDRVKAGQVLLRIDSREARQALAASQSQLAEARAAFSNAELNHERNAQLYAQKFLSKAALDQSELAYKAAKARLGAVQAGAGQAATAESYTTIAAPYAGVVAATPIEVGDMASPGRALVTLFDPANMRVVATLPQSSLRQVQLTLPVRVEVPAARRSLTASGVTLVPLADSRSHTARLRVELGEAGGLLPGQFARALFGTGTARKLVIPEQSVLRRSEVTAVYVQDAGGQMQLRQIRAGEASAGGYIEVLSGLREGEHIALEPVPAGLLPAAK